MNRLSRLLGELRRRRVYRAAIVYVVAAVAVVQAAESTLPRLGAPDSFVTFILVVSLLGLPLALWLAWTYELTPDGLARTAPAASTGGGSVAVAAAVLALLLAAGWWIVWGRSGSGSTRAGVSSTERSIAVLPFRDLSPGDSLSFLGEGLAEEIIGALTRIPGLRVIASQTSFQLADASVSEIRSRVGVTHVLSGSLRPDGDDLRIQARLVDTADQGIVWERPFRPEARRLGAAQEEIARLVVSVLEIELGPIGSGDLMPPRTDSREAHEEYLRGLRLWNNRSEPDILAAIGHFEDAVRIDSDYAAAWAGLAYAYLVLPEYSVTADVERVRRQSVAAATRALEIDPDQPDALTAMGWARMIHDYDWEAAESSIGRALEVDSTNVNALHWQSHVVSWQGRHDEAVDLARRGHELDPLSSIMQQNLGFILMEARRFQESLEEYRALSTRDPAFTISRRSMWNVYTRLGQYEQAAEALVEWLIGRGDDSGTADELARAFTGAATRYNEDGEFVGLPRSLLDRAGLGVEIEGQMLAAVGDVQGTLEVLELAYRERAGARNLLSIGINPLYDFVRDDPRFIDLLSRVGLDTVR